MNSRSIVDVSPNTSGVAIRLLPITLAVFVGFLTIGLPMPVLPLHAHETLHMNALLVGVVVGAQFAAALASRAWAGGIADVRGAKTAVVAGMLIAAGAGILYFGSLGFSVPGRAGAVLLGGRLALGCAESLIVTGALTWGVALVGAQHAGKVMAWVGIAMYGAYAVGAPAGVAVYAQWGFLGIAVATLLIPLAAIACVLFVPGTAPSAARRVPFYKILGKVWLPGLGLALSSIGFGSITAFIALLFVARHWGQASMAFTFFGAAFIAARLLFGHLPDKLGGARVALVCVGIEALGQLLIWSAHQSWVAYAGAALTGFGYSLAFPGFGVEAVRRAPVQSRGMAMGAYVAFLDISLAIAAPATGAIAHANGVDAVYLAGAIAVACAAAIALILIGKESRVHARDMLGR